MVNWTSVVAVAGNGAYGRLGLGVECASQAFFRIVGSLVGYNVKQVACGGAHTAVLTDDGSLFTFGLNDKGQLGHSSKDKFVPVPLEVGLPDPVEQVAAGEYHTLALTRAGEVWAWGSHESGQLGIGTEGIDKLRQPEPRLVKALSGMGVTRLAAGFEHSLALTGDPAPTPSNVMSRSNSSKASSSSTSKQPTELWAWGSAASGALGLGAHVAQREDMVAAPRRLRGSPLEGVPITALAAGPYTSGVVDGSGRAWAWGQGTYWQLGHGAAAHEYVPRQIQGLGSDVSSLSLGHSHGLAASRLGQSVMVWGTDDHGSLGQGEGNWQRVPLAVPQAVPNMQPGVAAVSAGWKHSAALTGDGRLFTWGWAGAYNTDATWRAVTLAESGSGQLGLGDDQDRWAPNQVQRLHTSAQRYYDLRMSFIKPWKVKQVSCGRTHTAIVVEVNLDTRDLS